jgi:hypothetical protein
VVEISSSLHSYSHIFKVFCLTTYDLTRTDPSQLDEEEKLTFWLNTYHTLMLHAFTELGSPPTFKLLSKLLSSVSYNIGGDVITLNEIEFAILRAPLAPPRSTGGIPSPVARYHKNDVRKKYALTRKEPLLPFLMNCGCKSCPKITVFHPQTISHSITICARAYLSKNIKLSQNKGVLVVTVPRMVHWYRLDFGKDKTAVLLFFMKYVSTSDPLYKVLMSAIDSKHEIIMEPLPFEWEFECTIERKVGGFVNVS